MFSRSCFVITTKTFSIFVFLVFIFKLSTSSYILHTVKILRASCLSKKKWNTRITQYTEAAAVSTTPVNMIEAAWPRLQDPILIYALFRFGIFTLLCIDHSSLLSWSTHNLWAFFYCARVTEIYLLCTRASIIHWCSSLSSSLPFFVYDYYHYNYTIVFI